ncbi:hypothetical protein Gocc_0664 [Gaiella occulta]|uniref:Uncharacterized protein n=1 Tax=Gaiella occulta TaxID=1002870 RepID=A0A7M2Z2D9_9ACTN|nr:hypothetical protein Gocc_0664 [Gaiella occulta]
MIHARAVPRLALETSKQLRLFTRRQWLVAACVAAATALLTGLPTDIVPNPFYRRMTPILWWDYPVWAATAVLAGLVFATYVRSRPAGSSVGATAGGGLMSFFAVGCPICNKLVVGLIGVGGALSFFAPLQPYLALGGLALLVLSLVLRLRALASCELEPVVPEPLLSAARGRIREGDATRAEP